MGIMGLCRCPTGPAVPAEKVDSTVALRLFAPAKVNLFLAVLGRREDGYHAVETCLHALEFGDELSAERGGGGISLEVEPEARSGSAVPTGPENIVCRAAQAFRAASGVSDGVRFWLRKRVPAGAGLGGGSSDAAAALLLMNHLFDQPLGMEELHRLASQLGADVAFFLAGGTQIGSGIGDRLAPVNDPPTLHFALLLPPYGVSTAEVYAQCGAPSLKEDPETNRLCANHAAWYRERAVTGKFENDLESAARKVEPRLADLCARVADLGYPQVRMSGSGSTLFLAFAGESEATQACATLAALADDGVNVVQTRSDHQPAVRRPVVVAESDGELRNRGGGTR